jgi:hypothetical protein
VQVSAHSSKSGAKLGVITVIRITGFLLAIPAGWPRTSAEEHTSAIQALPRVNNDVPHN